MAPLLLLPISPAFSPVVYPFNDPALPTDRRVADLLSRMTLHEKIGMMFMQGDMAFGNDRLPRGGVHVARRQSGARRPDYRPTARPFGATVPGGRAVRVRLSPAHMLTARFEPAARSWAQMPSGSGAPTRICGAAATYIPSKRI